MTDVGIKEVVLAHVQDVRRLRPHLDNKMDEFNKIDQERLDKIKTDLEKLGFSVKTIISEGIPSEKISGDSGLGRRQHDIHKLARQKPV